MPIGFYVMLFLRPLIGSCDFSSAHWDVRVNWFSGVEPPERLG